MRRIDAIHFALLLAAAGLAYLLPFELVLLSYVFLGPSHYLTEISWLHDRNYFLPRRGVALALIVVALAASFVENATWFGVIVWTAFVTCALLAGARTALQSVVLVMLAMAATFFLASRGPGFAIIGVLLPTLVHVSLFTLVFMVLGATRSRSPAQFGLVVVYLAVLTAILTILPSSATTIPAFAKSCTNPARPQCSAARSACLISNHATHRIAVVVYTYHIQLVHQAVSSVGPTCESAAAVVAALSIPRRRFTSTTTCWASRCCSA